MKTKLLSLALVVAGSGCATVPLSPERLEGAQSSVRAAQELGAGGIPKARLHLQLATDQIAESRKLAADGDKRAPLMLARGQADAELALGLAREVSVHLDAVQAEEALAELKKSPSP
jgi:hypothetical protein